MSGEMPAGTNSRLVDPKPSSPSGDPKRAHPNEGQTLKPQQFSEAPANLAGKDESGVLEDYKRLQSELGRRANEIGELRQKLAKLEADKKPDPTPDYWDDPDKATDAKLAPLREKIAQIEAEKARAELRSTHPDYESIVSTPEFGEWVRDKRSRVLLAQAGDSGDVDSARELLDLYKSAVENGDETPKQAVKRDRQARAGAAERGSGKRPTGQIYSRAEIQNLRAFNKRRYEELLPDIKRAYAEGRVRE